MADAVPRVQPSVEYADSLARAPLKLGEAESGAEERAAFGHLNHTEPRPRGVVVPIVAAARVMRAAVAPQPPASGVPLKDPFRSRKARWRACGPDHLHVPRAQLLLV